MTIPAKGWLVLRRAAGERPPQRPDTRKGVRLGVQTQASRQNLRTGLDREHRSATITTLEAANGKYRKDWHNGAATQARIAAKEIVSFDRAVRFHMIGARNLIIGKCQVRSQNVPRSSFGARQETVL